MKIFSKESDDWFAEFHERHKDDVLATPGILIPGAILIFVYCIILMFATVGYSQVQLNWEKTHGNFSFDDSIIGLIGNVCILFLGPALPIGLIALWVIFMGCIACGEIVVKERKANQLKLWEV